jgi:hypothetical protein
VVKEELNELFKKKDVLREAYYKDKLEFEIQKDEVNHIEWMTRQKQYFIDREENRKKRIEERKQMLKDRSNPYEKEIETCDHLIAFCNKLKIQHGLAEAPGQDDIKNTQKEFLKQTNVEDVNKRLQEGKLERAKTKAEKEQEQMLQIGGKKKNKGKKAKKESLVEEAFNIDFSVINKFAFLKVNVPLGPEELDNKIKELSEKREKYFVEGEQRLKEEEEKLGDPEAVLEDF